LSPAARRSKKAGAAEKPRPLVTIDELKKIERYLRRLFGSETLAVRTRPKKDDSAEVFVAGEFIGLIYRDDEEGDLSYNFTMAILAEDLG
jgi:hypothetical protein